MKIFLIYSILFFFFSFFGWTLEFFFRRFFSAKKWMNPGFLKGPWLPIYGVSACFIYFFVPNKITSIVQIFGSILFLTMLFLGMEFVVGLFFLKVCHIRLWDYRNVKRNILGIICPKYTFFWLLLATIGFFLLYRFRPYLDLLSGNKEILSVCIFFIFVFFFDFFMTIYRQKRNRNIKKKFLSYFSFLGFSRNKQIKRKEEEKEKNFFNST